MKWNDFYKSVQERRFQSVYLFAGPEALNKQRALAALKRAALAPGFEEVNGVTLENCGAQAIIDSAETLPLMGDKRVVVVRDWALLTSKKAENEARDAARMLEWLKNPPESAIVVFYMTVELDGRKKLAAALKKLDGYVEFDRLSGSQLAKWCERELAPLGKKLRPDALDELTMMVGQDLTRIAEELKKLAAYVENAAEIGPEDVRAIVAPSPEYTAFMIMDHLLEGRLAEATQVVNSVLQTEPSGVRLINLFANQLRIDAHIKYALEAKGNMPETLRALNVSQGRFYHIQRQIRPLSGDALEKRYQDCVNANYDILSGRLNERAALNDLMLKIAMPRRATK